MTRYQQGLHPRRRPPSRAPAVSPAGRPCTSPSTITPVSPSPRMLPNQTVDSAIAFLRAALAFYADRYHHSPACSPTTDLAIAPTAFAPLVRNSASAIASLALTLRAPTVRPNASSKPLFASGPTSATTPTPKNAISNSPPGSTTTTSPALMVASVTLLLSAALLPQVQRLDRSQAART